MSCIIIIIIIIIIMFTNKHFFSNKKNTKNLDMPLLLSILNWDFFSGHFLLIKMCYNLFTS